MDDGRARHLRVRPMRVRLRGRTRWDRRSGHTRGVDPPGRRPDRVYQRYGRSPDGSTLIVAESIACRLTALDIADDGSLSDRRVWAEGIEPDGITLHAEAACGGRSPPIRRACGSVRAARLVRIELDRNRSRACSSVRTGGRCSSSPGKWRGIEELEEALATRTGQVLLSHPGLERVGHNSLSL